MLTFGCLSLSQLYLLQVRLKDYLEPSQIIKFSQLSASTCSFCFRFVYPVSLHLPGDPLANLINNAFFLLKAESPIEYNGRPDLAEMQAAGVPHIVVI